MLEGVRNEAYLDGIEDPKNPAKYISAKKFYSLSVEEQEKLRDSCVDKSGKRKDPITTVGIEVNINSDKVRDRFDKILGKPELM